MEYLVFTLCLLLSGVRLEILKPVVAGFSLRFLSQTHPKGMRLPGVCIKTENKDDKMGGAGRRIALPPISPSTLWGEGWGEGGC